MKPKKKRKPNSPSEKLFKGEKEGFVIATQIGSCFSFQLSQCVSDMIRFYFKEGWMRGYFERQKQERGPDHELLFGTKNKKGKRK